ncbi:MAG: hypothetical protein AAF903_10085 [Pseudomonadota bacterium]
MAWGTMACRFFIPLLMPVLLWGCVNSSPDFVLSQPPLIPGRGSDTGQIPNINDVPRGETAQLTKAETAAAKQQLARDAQPAQAQAQQATNEEAAYRAEVEALRRLAEEQKRRRLADIESRQY